LEAKAERGQKAHTTNNPFGFDNGAWDKGLHKVVDSGASRTTEQDFIHQVQTSVEWTDLDILLQAYMNWVASRCS
jgi:poly-D-alanine transfer protein DltD